MSDKRNYSNRDINDKRPSNWSGGHNNNNNNNNNQNYRDYSNNSNNHNNNNYNNNKGNDNRPNKKQKVEDINFHSLSRRDFQHKVRHDPIQRADPIKSALLTVGDKNKDLDLEEIAKQINSEWKSRQQELVDHLLQCVIYLGAKEPVYGTLVGLMNAKNAQIGKEVVETCSKTLSELLSSQDLSKVKNVVRFLGCLVNSNVLMAHSFIDLLNHFLSSISDLQSIKKDSDVSFVQSLHYRADYYVLLVLQSLPWVGKELSQRKSKEVSEILEKIGTYMKNREFIVNNVMKSFASSTGDRVGDWWESVTECSKSDWNSSIIDSHSPYLHLLTLSLTHHSIPSMPNLPKEEFFYWPSAESLELFPERIKYKDIGPVDFLILQDYCRDLYSNFESSHKDCIKQVLNLPVDKGMDIALVESVMGEIFTLPSPPFKLVYYYSLIIDCCKSRQSFSPALGFVIDKIFNSLEEMDGECFERAVEWFSFHLLNTNYKWDWPRWEYVNELETLNPKRIFLEEVLTTVMRSSYFEMVKKQIPASFHSFISAKLEPNFQFESPQSEGFQIAQEFVKLFQERKPSSDLEKLISEKLGDASQKQKINIIFSCFFHVCGKAFSHLMNGFDRYLGVLRNICGEEKVEVVNVAANHWNKNGDKMLTIFIDRAMTVRLIDNISIVTWIFQKSNYSRLSRVSVWEVLRGTFAKTLARSASIRNDYQQSQSTFASIASSDPSFAVESARVAEKKTKLENSLKEEKELFVFTFQKFTIALADFLDNHKNAMKTSSAMDVDKEEYFSQFWFNSVLSHCKELVRRYPKEVNIFLPSLEDLVFTDDLPSDLISLFKDIKTLCLSIR